MNTTFADAIGWAREASGAGGAIDEASALEAIERAKQATAKAIAMADEAARESAAGGRQAADKRQALFDAAYMIAAADGEVTSEERAKIGAALGAFLGEAVDASVIEGGLELARSYLFEHGAVALTESIARAVPETDGRASILTLASAIGWLGGGVGTKEGLVLQALARAFGVALADLHKLMAVGKVV